MTVEDHDSSDESCFVKNYNMISWLLFKVVFFPKTLLQAKAPKKDFNNLCMHYINTFSEAVDRKLNFFLFFNQIVQKPQAVSNSRYYLLREAACKI